MDTIQIYVQCYNRFFEVLQDEIENAELAVEDVMCNTLIALFEGGVIDDVTINFFPRLATGLQHCAISICARCASERFTALPRSEEHIQQAIKSYLGSLLRELFGPVIIDDVILSPVSPWGLGNDPALSFCI